MHITNLIKKNCEKVVGDYMKAYRDCISIVWLCKYQKGFVGVLKLAQKAVRLHYS